MATRADVLLVEKGLAPSRNRAQELIQQGRVFVLSGSARKAVTKPSQSFDSSTVLEVVEDAETFVSRGGLKMKGALGRTQLDVRGWNVLDIGISTGGFADCLLQAGARSVVGVDVGHGQLAPRLSRDPRVRLIEGVNARDLSGTLEVGARFDLIVIDVSFISLTLVLPEAIRYLNESARILALVKPQFEVGREGLGKGGIVKDPARWLEVEAKIRGACSAQGLRVEDYFESSIEGSDGNREFFVHACPAQMLLGL